MFRTPALASLFCFGLLTISFAEEIPLRDAVESTPRDGIPNVRAKIEAGETIQVAYLGGSITAASGWRVKSRDWLASQYPDATFEEIFAAIGGTGSNLGVFRVQNDVLRHEPDLLFVEFAVNDGGAHPEQIHKSMEGIVRQTLKANSKTDIIFVYTLQATMLEGYKSGQLSRSATAMEDVADHYGIPSIAFGVKVAALEKAGELVFKGEKSGENVFSTDGVHPIEWGHQLYTDTLARAWPSLWAASGAPGPHPLPTPLREDNWENAKQVAITPSMLSEGWQTLPEDHELAKRFARNFPQLHQATQAGATLTFEFDGISASVFDLVGPDGGQLEVLVDDRPAKQVKRIDGYCTYHRMSQSTIASEIPSGRHKVTVKLSPESLDKREILFEKNREYYDQHPEKYEPHIWNIGWLLIIGDIVE